MMYACFISCFQSRRSKHLKDKLVATFISQWLTLSGRVRILAAAFVLLQFSVSLKVPTTPISVVYKVLVLVQ